MALVKSKCVTVTLMEFPLCRVEVQQSSSQSDRGRCVLLWEQTVLTLLVKKCFTYKKQKEKKEKKAVL